ncbi:hypothetical protein SAY87_012490 [Trapa incisa]|uniref:Uncharacterized protein n=1 Tax=Trapa incisa TaxID=236973 RepID=A0AAN7GSQ2_9MYRT|nr:hypothetical protein SAY87_012490 [Trapa incisa]
MAPQPPEPVASTPPPAPLHSDDADEDDENVKQIRECSSLISVHRKLKDVDLAFIRFKPLRCATRGEAITGQNDAQEHGR